MIRFSAEHLCSKSFLWGMYSILYTENRLLTMTWASCWLTDSIFLAMTSECKFNGADYVDDEINELQWIPGWLINLQRFRRRQIKMWMIWEGDMLPKWADLNLHQWCSLAGATLAIAAHSNLFFAWFPPLLEGGQKVITLYKIMNCTLQRT